MNLQKKWLSVNNENGLTKVIVNDLIVAVKQADKECGNCGCDYDLLYKSTLELLKTVYLSLWNSLKRHKLMIKMSSK